MKNFGNKFKQYVPSIIVYGLIILGILIIIAIFIIKPQKTIEVETVKDISYTDITPIKFPVTEEVHLSPNAQYIELRLGNNVNLEHPASLKIEGFIEDKSVLEYEYENFGSNAIAIPTLSPDINLSESPTLTLHLTCSKNCNDNDLRIFNINNESHPQIILGESKVSYTNIWYGAFCIIVGLTLMPLLNKRKQHAQK